MKVIKSISISQDILTQIDEDMLGMSFSKAVEELLINNYLGLKAKREKLIACESEAAKLRKIIEIEEKALNKEEFFGFCSCCGEPMRKVKLISKEPVFAVCATCGSSRLEEVIELSRKIKKEVLK